MDEIELKARVNAIIARSGDDETAHSDEDKLHLALIHQFCPEWVRDEIKRLQKSDFNRWCA